MLKEWLRKKGVYLEDFSCPPVPKPLTKKDKIELNSDIKRGDKVRLNWYPFYCGEVVDIRIQKKKYRKPRIKYKILFKGFSNKYNKRPTHWLFRKEIKKR